MLRSPIHETNSPRRTVRDELSAHRSHGIIIYFNLGEYFHVEMAKRTRSPTGYDRRILWSVSTEKRIRWSISSRRCLLWSYRYIDDGFMTWNKSEQELRKLLDEANTWHHNIKLDYQIGRGLPFLDVLLTSQNGILSPSIYHKPSAEPYVIPFISYHPRHVFANIIQGALARAVLYSSTSEAFDHERRYIKLMLLYNGWVTSVDRSNSIFYLCISVLGYLSKFIEDQFRNFLWSIHQYLHFYHMSTTKNNFVVCERNS